MDQEKNTRGKGASIARQKRKVVLREKGSTFSRRIIWKRNQIHKQQVNGFPSSINTTPLSDISASILNQRNQNSSDLQRNSSSNSYLYTQPTTSQKNLQKRQRTIRLDGCGVNLMSRYPVMNNLQGKENNPHNVNNEPSSSTSQRFSTASTIHSSRTSEHVSTEVELDFSDEEHNSDLDVEQEEQYSNFNATQQTNETGGS